VSVHPTGFYNQAFFNISIGFERLLKLIFLIEYRLTHAGTFPSEEDLRSRFGHDLKRLFEEAIAIRQRLQDKGQRFQWELADEDLAIRIVNFLAEFARATRYYNLDYLVGARRIGRDPLDAWAKDVASYLVKRYPASRRARDAEWPLKRSSCSKATRPCSRRPRPASRSGRLASQRFRDAWLIGSSKRRRFTPPP
jgi:hypothetical protein